MGCLSRRRKKDMQEKIEEREMLDAMRDNNLSEKPGCFGNLNYCPVAVRLELKFDR